MSEAETEQSHTAGDVLKKRYHIWYRHTGQTDPGEKMWYVKAMQSLTLQQIEEMVRGLRITHMCIDCDIPPDMHKLAPNLTHLRLYGLTEKDSSNLEWIGELMDLQELHVWSSDNLLTLPDSIGKLHELTHLYLQDNRSLVSLPESIGNLQKLTSLQLYSNNKLKSLPDSLGKLYELIYLDISVNNSLGPLPESIGNLRKLTGLKIHDNSNLKALPESIGNLHELTDLDLRYNGNLESLPESICNLRSLTELKVYGCRSLRSPPIEACERGIESIRQYFKDLASGSEKITPAVTVAVIGRTMAGKTSLIKTLQNEAKERILTHRGPDAALDEATKVFNVQQVKADDALLRFIDVGGQDVYHPTYQLTFRSSCIPLVVANIEHFREMRQVQGINAREAVKLLCFDWLAQIYVACPKLGPPKLVFTHVDKFSENSGSFEKLRSEFLTTCQILKKAVMDESDLVTDGDQVSLIDHFVHEKNVFLPKDIYSVGKYTEYSVFEDIIESLRIECMALSREIPSIWITISKALDSCKGAVVSMSDLLSKLQDFDVETRQLEVVLTYLVNCGKVLWYPHLDDIQENIFHSIEKVTCLIGILFAHDDHKCWSERKDKFKPFISGSGLIIEQEEFCLLYDQYKESGVMSEDILSYLIKEESDFKAHHELEIALNLLSHFRLIFGPVDNKGQPGFILPHFTSGYQSAYLATAHNEMCLHADMALKGMTVPRHVYHQISIGVMQFFPRSTDNVVLSKNGLTAYKDGTSLCLTHDFNSKIVTFEVAGKSRSVKKMWEMAISVTESAVQHLKTSWKAARHIISFTCAHCLLVGNRHPAKVINPRWLKDENSRVEPMMEVMCKSHSGVPACLNHPCKSPTEKESALLEKYVKDHRRTDSSGWDDMRHMKDNISGEASMRAEYDTHSAGYESDISDGGGYLVPEEDDFKYDVRLSVKPTQNPAVQALSVITDKVFKMSHPKRGRALIINIENFCGSTVSEGLSLRRRGSTVDVKNLQVVLQELQFDVVVRDDCDGKDIIAEITNEAQNTDHEDYGMFFLCIMSHGGRDGVIIGSDKAGVTLIDICDLLAPSRFPSMAGKPKVVVIQACSGERGDDGMLEDKSSSPQDSGTRPKNKASTGFTSDSRPRPDRIDHLNVDDLFIMRSSFESYKSLRNEEWGSLFIRCLVITFYKHACHRDMYSLFKIIQDRVRRESIKIAEKYPDKYGQTVTANDTLSGQRKLYLFPGYKPPPTFHPEGKSPDPPESNKEGPSDSKMSTRQVLIDETHVGLRDNIYEEYRESPPVEYLADQHSDGYDSDEISDGGGFLAPDKEDTHMYQIRLRVRPTEDPEVKDLFNEPDKIYKMSSSRRGRALIINLGNFAASKGMNSCIKGSAMDVKNLENMLRDFNFEVTEVKKDGNGKEILDYIAQETRNTVHEHYGMFFLCIMSHGLEDDVILSSDLAGLKLRDICDILSPKRFTGMAGKPKVIVLQSCCGDRVKDVNKVTHPDNLDIGQALLTSPETYLDSGVTPPNLRKMQSEQLTVEDFFVLKPNFDSHQTRRCEESGSLFIRCLVTTFYKHACHRDIHSLYQIVRDRVRAESNKQAEKYPDQFSGQTVTAIDTLSRQRKLYLFPGYDPPPTSQPEGASAS